MLANTFANHRCIRACAAEQMASLDAIGSPGTKETDSVSISLGHISVRVTVSGENVNIYIRRAVHSHPAGAASGSGSEQ